MNRAYYLARIEADIAGLDLTAENDRIAGIRENVGEAEAALQRANARRGEIAAEITAIREAEGGTRRVDTAGGRRVADALMIGVAASDAAAATKQEGQLEQERNALTAGATELLRRLEEARVQVAAIQRDARARLKPIVEPLIESELLKAQDAARIIVESFAVLSAIGFAAEVGTNEAQRAKTCLLPGIMGEFGLLPPERAIDVPAEVQTALVGLKRLGPAAGLCAVVPSINLI